MNIDWTAFTPWSALIGGVIIGIATAILALFNGRVAGISGIVGVLLRPPIPDWTWRAVLIAGLLLAPVVYAAFRTLSAVTIDAGYRALIIAGLLVGVGTRYASGCTSGHGICGMSRLSLRSIVATLTFMAAGFVTVYLMRHALNP